MCSHSFECYVSNQILELKLSALYEQFTFHEENVICACPSKTCRWPANISMIFLLYSGAPQGALYAAKRRKK